MRARDSYESVVGGPDDDDSLLCVERLLRCVFLARRGGSPIEFVSSSSSFFLQNSFLARTLTPVARCTPRRAASPSPPRESSLDKQQHQQQQRRRRRNQKCKKKKKKLNARNDKRRSYRETQSDNTIIRGRSIILCTRALIACFFDLGRAARNGFCFSHSRRRRHFHGPRTTTRHTVVFLFFAFLRDTTSRAEPKVFDPIRGGRKDFFTIICNLRE